MINRIYLDMDGVLANFCEHAFAKSGKVYNPSDFLGKTSHDIVPWFDWRKADRHFWATIPEEDDAVQLMKKAIRLVGKDSVFICSTPLKHELRAPSIEGKMDWLADFVRNNQIDFDFESQAVFTANKAACAAPTHLLIDDRDKVTDGFARAGGQTLIRPHPWNSRYRDWVRGWMVVVEDLQNLYEENLKGN
jgi:hypothetical protein